MRIGELYQIINGEIYAISEIEKTPSTLLVKSDIFTVIDMDDSKYINVYHYFPKEKRQRPYRAIKYKVMFVKNGKINKGSFRVEKRFDNDNLIEIIRYDYKLKEYYSIIIEKK